jgi:CBS-domain-containing membrane protein
MKARDVMTIEVVSVSPDTPVRSVAELLLTKGISAVPVVDATGAPIGMVSEGDLIGRSVTEFNARRDWWLCMLAEGTQLPEVYSDYVKTSDRPVRNVMAAPVITIGEDATVDEVALLLETHHIKRVPVIRGGKMVGIISRSNLLRALSKLQFPSEGVSLLRRRADDVPAPVPHLAVTSSPSASVFRSLMAAFDNIRHDRDIAERQAVAQERRRRVEALLDEHIGPARWQTLVLHAREAAEHGEKSYMLLRFPSDLCSDGGRAINAPEPEWGSTLRGEAAELYLYWERELKSQGFGLAAYVLDYPDGVPGDVGLFLTWGE